MGIHLARKYGCRGVAEIADLWPESIVAYGIAGPRNPAVLALRRLEKWIYEKADDVVFTCEGGYDYIVEQGWEGRIPRAKIHYINNGVDLAVFDENRARYTVQDPDLEDPSVFKVVYTGSIRKVNHLGLLLDAATGELRSVVEREEMLRELLGILKDVKAALTAPEADLAALLEEQLCRQKTRIDTGRRSGSLSQEAERSHRRIIAALERQKALVGQTVDSQTGFAAVKADFDQMVQGLKAQAKTAGEMLNNLFAFCEEVFPEGQELLILVTELTINYYAATFISRYGCDAYFTHNQELLFYERQQEIISQLESLELN